MQDDLFTRGVEEENEKLIRIRKAPTIEDRLAMIIQRSSAHRRVCDCGTPMFFLRHHDVGSGPLPRYQLDGINHQEVCPYTIHEENPWPRSAQTIEDRLADIVRRIAEYEKVCSCGAYIYFLGHNDTAKLTPYQLDGVNHFTTCPVAARYRRRS
jgi:hypothetical protein